LVESTATWQTNLPALNRGRLFNNTVVLPDGSLCTFGGAAREYRIQGEPVLPIREPELLEPGADAWRLLNPSTHRRLYHSAAVLLADARVLVVGGEFFNTVAQRSTTGTWLNQIDHLFESDAEIFSPPYLFHGPRPIIGFAPNQISYSPPGGSTSFVVEVIYQPEATIDGFVLIRPSSATHSTDFEQLYVELPVLSSGGVSEVPGGASQSFELRAPFHDAGNPGASHIAPPGYYMLFVRTRQGTAQVRVPSEAHILRLP
jgi:hypothetical protein